MLLLVFRIIIILFFRSIIQKWMEYFPEFVSSFSIKDFLLSHDDEIKWIDYGLPSDSTAVNNAILINEVF